MSLVDPAKAQEFKKKNTIAAAEHAKAHGHHGHGGGCCGEVNAYHYPESEMSTVDKAINSKVKSDMFFRDNLVKILERTNQAVTAITKRAKEKGMEVDEAMLKELYAKSMLETVNRLIF